MTSAEKRICKIEAAAGEAETEFAMFNAVVCALCECARQLARLADLYQFELGLDDGREIPTMVEPTAPGPVPVPAPQFSAEFLDTAEATRIAEKVSACITEEMAGD